MESVYTEIFSPGAFIFLIWMLDFKSTKFLTICIPATPIFKPGVVSQTPYGLRQTHYTSKPVYTKTFSPGALIFLIWMLDFKSVQELNQQPQASQAVFFLHAHSTVSFFLELFTLYLSFLTLKGAAWYWTHNLWLRDQMFYSGPLDLLHLQHSLPTAWSTTTKTLLSVSWSFSGFSQSVWLENECQV